MRYFVLDQPIENRTQITLTKDQAHHVQHVLRLKPGSKVGVFDGSGGEFTGRITRIDATGVTLQVGPVRITAQESTLEITLIQGMLKEGKMDRLVRPLTELGVTRWVPFIAQRSVARPDAKRLAKRLVRWQKISQEAQKQCRRPRAMDIQPAHNLTEALKTAPNEGPKWILYEQARTPLADPPVSTRQISLLIGPEGGFDPAEVQQAQTAGFDLIGLGQRILRAQTAAIAIAAIVQNRFGDLGQKNN